MVCFPFHSLLLPWQHFIPKYIICPLRLPEGGPWNAARPTYSYGLISNCLFLRIIPNGCAAKPLSTLSWDYGSLRAAVLMYVSPATGAILIWGGDWGIYQYIRNDTEIQQRTFSSPTRQFAVQSSVCASVPVPLVIPCIYTHWNSVQGPGEQEPEERLEQVQPHTDG